MAYSARYIEHFSNPHGVGEIEHPDFASEVEHQGGGCFDRVRLTIHVEVGRISEARFKARACSGTIAACSALIELIEGLSESEAASVNSADIIKHLDGIPETKQHSVDLAASALAKALAAHCCLEESV